MAHRQARQRGQQQRRVRRLNVLVNVGGGLLEHERPKVRDLRHERVALGVQRGRQLDLVADWEVLAGGRFDTSTTRTKHTDFGLDVFKLLLEVAELLVCNGRLVGREGWRGHGWDWWGAREVVLNEPQEYQGASEIELSYWAKPFIRGSCLSALSGVWFVPPPGQPMAAGIPSNQALST